jgi:hypothetical protein
MPIPTNVTLPTVVPSFPSYAATPVNTAEQVLVEKLPDFVEVARTAFEDGYAAAKSPIGTLSAEQWDTKKQKGKSQMLSALQQLEQAAKILSNQRKRSGFDALMRILETTRDAAVAANGKAVTQVNAASPPALSALADLLAKLAPLLPTAVWAETADE